MPQIQISGSVHSIGWEGKRIQIWERYPSNGKEWSILWTCWFTTPQHDKLQEEDWVEIYGELGTMVGSYKPKDGEERPVVEHMTNDSVLVQVKTKAQQQSHADKFEDMPF